ncbi:MAG: DUF4159 domain-containing protein [Pseudomonas sp.]
MHTWPRIAVWLLAGACLLIGTSLTAQNRGWGREGPLRSPLREGLPDRRGGFMFCRMLFTQAFSLPSGFGWSTDYPRSDQNFMTRLPQLTATGVSKWDDGEPGHAVVRPTDENLFQCPFLFASDIGTAEFSDAEVTALRAYLMKGGFLWVDDFWGRRAWRQWSSQIERVLPEYQIQDLTRDHPLFSTFYELLEIPQIPSMQSWYRTGGQAWESGFERGDPHMGAITNERGRILVIMTHNTDIADGWERETDNEDFFYAFTARAYGVGINVAVWAMSH